MHIISVMNKKGGVGKTTTSINLTAELNRRGFRTANIDLDEQSDLTRTLHPYPWSVGIKELLEGECSIEDIYYENNDQMRYVLGSKDIGDYSDNKVDLRRIIVDAGFEDEVDFVIIDHPTEVTDATIKGLLASDYILIVTEVETLSIDNLLPMIETLEAVCSNHDKPFNIIGIVANKVDNRRKLTKMNLEKLSRMLGDSLFKTYISTNTMIPYAIQVGKPLRKVGWCKAAKQYSLLAEEILKRIKSNEQK